MKRFRFRLQKYLNLKQQEEGIRRIYLAEAQHLYQKQEEKMRSIQKELKNTLAQKREFLQGRIDPDLIEMAECYLEYQKEQQSRQAAILEEIRAELIRRQQELLKAQKERKLSERLYYRRWTAYYQEFLREEQKSLDEIGIICFFRQQEDSVR